ncbi:hypothetical protein GCM10023350_42270 [Nocardioides endophyticus]|uniref:Uncharacterized protein n=1 Tax=Nocardioides endophyticus TaxID=1353775 RepID=A0ABP8ZBY0_9ACTN
MARRSSVDREDGGVVGQEGRVTGTVGPGLVGEVILPVRGGLIASITGSSTSTTDTADTTSTQDASASAS